MNAVLDRWNRAEDSEALSAMIACCGAKRWAEAMVALRPMASVVELSLAADRVWSTMEEAAHASAKSQAWSRQEQSSAEDAEEAVLAELAAGNEVYEEQFGFTYIVCATGKSAEEMLSILNRRLGSERAAELREAAEQQRQITQIRLGKWLVA